MRARGFFEFDDVVAQCDSVLVGEALRGSLLRVFVIGIVLRLLSGVFGVEVLFFDFVEEDVAVHSPFEFSLERGVGASVFLCEGMDGESRFASSIDVVIPELL